MAFTFIFLVASVFQIYEFYLMMRCFFDECRVSQKEEFLTYVGLFVVMTVPYLAFGTPMITLVCSYSGAILVAVIAYKGNWKKKILSGTFTFAIMAMSECIVALFFGYTNMDVFESTEYYSILGTVCLPIVQYLIVQIMRNFKNIKKGEQVPISYWIISITLPVFSICLYTMFYRQAYSEVVILVCCAGMLFIINIFVFYLYDHQIENFRMRQEKETLEIQNKYQESQLELMHGMVEQSSAQRHDFLKHISMVGYMVEQGDRKELSKYLKEIESNIERQQRYVDSGNFVIDSILNYKLQEMVTEDIAVTAKVTVPAELELSVYDMNIILTNLLDNSREAVKALPEEDRKVDIKIDYVTECLNIRVMNAYDTIKQNDQGEYITTKQDKEQHGYGLKNVQNVVEKYDGVTKIDTKGHVFDVNTSLFL